MSKWGKPSRHCKRQEMGNCICDSVIVEVMIDVELGISLLFVSWSRSFWNMESKVISNTTILESNITIPILWFKACRSMRLSNSMLAKNQTSKYRSTIAWAADLIYLHLWMLSSALSSTDKKAPFVRERLEVQRQVVRCDVLRTYHRVRLKKRCRVRNLRARQISLARLSRRGISSVHSH